MSMLSKTMTGVFGTSWKTSILGYGQFLLVTIWSGYQAANGDLNAQGWIQLVGSAVIALALRMAKDHDVTNAPNEVPPKVVDPNAKPIPSPAQIISAASMITGQKGDAPPHQP